MLAIDTNLIIRILIGDHLQQSGRARAFVEENRVWVSTTVLLEVEWVLRSAYKLPKPEVISSLKDFVGLPNVTLQEPEQVSLALDWTTKGMDFADALHLAAAQSSETFVTFDRQLASVAKLVGASPVRLL